MYRQSELTSEIRDEFNNVVPQDDSNQEWQTFNDWRLNGGVIQLVEFFTDEDLARRQKRALEIDLEYTDRIFIDIEIKHVGRGSRDSNYVWPQIALDDIARLRSECNEKITEETGITDYSYRQSIPKLATFNINP